MALRFGENMYTRKLEMKKEGLKKFNEQRKANRDERYHYIYKRLKRLYLIHYRQLVDKRGVDTWTDIVRKYGIPYLVEKNKDIIDVNNKEMVRCIFNGTFFREDWE